MKAYETVLLSVGRIEAGLFVSTGAYQQRTPSSSICCESKNRSLLYS